MTDDGVGTVGVGVCQGMSLLVKSQKPKKAISRLKPPFCIVRSLERLYVLSLQTLGALGHVELHGLAFLQALETARLDCGEMHENIFATLAANESVALGIVKPLYCSLFHVFVLDPL